MFNDKRKLEAMSISFDDDDVYNDEHHDGLDSLTFSNYLLKRVLMDDGSCVNVLFKSALEGMSIDERDMTKKSTMSVGVSGETQQTIGEIVLHGYAEGLNL